jgi:hypothetical protein
MAIGGYSINGYWWFSIIVPTFAFGKKINKYSVSKKF